MIDLLGWAADEYSAPVPVAAIPCALVLQVGGSVELAPISAERLLSTTRHIVAGMPMPESAVSGSACSVEAIYASLGVAVLASVLDGDCAFDVVTMMLRMPSSF